MKAITFRVPEVLRNWLENRAKDNHRSMNGEMLELMQRAKERQERKQINTQ